MLTRLLRTLSAHRLFTAILIGYIVLAVGFSVANPIYESTDELHHFRYIRYIQQYGALPEQRDDQPRIQAHHPPLYYVIAALATGWIAPDHDALYEPTPNPYLGYRQWEINNDNKNRYLHGPDEAWPYHGVVLMVHVARWVNVLLGAIMVWVTYQIGLTLVNAPAGSSDPAGTRIWQHRTAPTQWVQVSASSNKGIAAGAAAIVAFNPQFLFMSGAINNDVIAGLFGSILVWQGVMIIRGGLSTRRSILLALAFGLALMAKFNLAFALPLIELALLIGAWPKRDWRGFIRANVFLAIGVAVFAGWWFVRNSQLYGEPTGVQRMNELWGGRDPRESFWLAVSEIPYAWSSLWGRFGYGQIPLPDAIYTGALIVTILGLIGLIIAFVRRTFDHSQLKQLTLVSCSALLFAAALFGYMMSSTAGPMGRFYFPGLSAFGLLLALGLSTLMQEAKGRKQEARSKMQDARGKMQDASQRVGESANRYAVRITQYVVPVAAFALACIAFFGYFIPAYAAPTLLDDVRIDRPLNVIFDGKAELLGAQVDRAQAQSGDPVKVTLTWRALAAMDQTYVEFVHLIDGDGIIVAQRDTWPGRGLYPTILWQPGQVFADELTLHVPDGAYAPNVATLRVGLYNSQGARLVAEGANLEDNAAAIGQIALTPQSGDYPNSMQVDFGNTVELMGYDMSPRAILPGEAVTVTLYWRSTASFAADFQVFLNAIRPETGRKSAEATGKPLGGTLATTQWPVGQVITDVRVLKFPPTAKPGLLDIEVGWFLPGTGRLSLLADDGHVLDDKQLLSKMRVK